MLHGAGFWTRNFYWDGDPCEYLHTALLHVPRAQLTAGVGEVASAAPHEVQARIALQNAVLAAFANTSALAFIHGALSAILRQLGIWRIVYCTRTGTTYLLCTIQ